MVFPEHNRQINGGIPAAFISGCAGYVLRGPERVAWRFRSKGGPGLDFQRSRVREVPAQGRRNQTAGQGIEVRIRVRTGWHQPRNGAQVGQQQKRIAEEYPSNTSSEAAVLGGLMTDPANIHHAMAILGADDFFIETHKEIYRTIMDLAAKNFSVDVVTVGDLLKLRGHDIRLGAFVSVGSFLGNFEAHCIIVKDLAKRRKAQSIFEAARLSVHADDIDATISRIAGELLGITVDKRQEPVTLGDAGMQAMAAIEKAMAAGPLGAGIKIGIREFDERFGGLFITDQFIVGARPGMGKTAWATTIAVNAAAIQGTHSLIINVEMPPSQIGQRVISSRTGIENIKLRRGQLSDYEIMQVVQEGGLLHDLPVKILRERDWGRIKAQVKAEKYRDPELKIVVYDFINRMRLATTRRDRREELAIISAEAKSIASDLEICSVVLAQTKRENDKDKKPPTMSDLRECGNIEEDADFVTFLHPNAKHNGRVDWMFAKARNAPLDDVPLHYDGKRVTFYDWEGV